jgi:hypothetical protein
MGGIELHKSEFKFAVGQLPTVRGWNPKLGGACLTPRTLDTNLEVQYAVAMMNSTLLNMMHIDYLCLRRSLYTNADAIMMFSLSSLPLIPHADLTGDPSSNSTFCHLFIFAAEIHPIPSRLSRRRRSRSQLSSAFDTLSLGFGLHHLSLRLTFVCMCITVVRRVSIISKIVCFFLTRVVGGRLCIRTADASPRPFCDRSATTGFVFDLKPGELSS